MACLSLSQCYARLTARSTPRTSERRTQSNSATLDNFMSRNLPSACIPSDAGAAVVDSKKLITKDARSRQSVKQAKEIPPESPEIPRAHKNGNRIGINQRTRILQK